MLKLLLWATLVILPSCKNDRVEKEVSLSGLEPAQAIRIEDSSEEVIKLLSQVETYSDYAEIRGVRSYKTRAKIQALDFGVSFVDEYLRTVGGWSINVNYLVKEDTIGWGMIIAIDSSYVNLITPTVFTQDSTFLKRYVQKHNAHYQSQHSVSQLKREMFLENLPIEIACGNGSSRYGTREIELFTAVARQDSDYVISQLKSINPERQVLGLIGLDKLIKAGFQSSEDIAAIYEHIIRRNSLVSACVSCTGGNYPVKTYLDMLQWDKVPNIELRKHKPLKK